MRKRKYHQPVPVTRQVPTRGLPSFMTARDSQTEIEQMLKLKVDSNIVKEFLGQTQNLIGSMSQSHLSQQHFMKHQSQIKEVKLNLIDEYKQHLNTVSKMPNFASLKMYMDHQFFKVFMPDDVICSQGAVFSQDNESEPEISLKSTIVPTIESFLEPQQESMIPTEP